MSHFGGEPLAAAQTEDLPTSSRRRIAVIGSGVAGLTAACILQQHDDVTLFEAGGRFGGHADTHQTYLGDGSTIGVDTGFIVHNERTYPTLLRLFDELGVETQDSDMTMSVRCDGCRFAAMDVGSNMQVPRGSRACSRSRNRWSVRGT